MGYLHAWKLFHYQPRSLFGFDSDFGIHDLFFNVSETEIFRTKRKLKKYEESLSHYNLLRSIATEKIIPLSQQFLRRSHARLQSSSLTYRSQRTKLTHHRIFF